METKNKLLTLIVPIYNVELYLEQCLESILLQKSDELEVILVNDGSTDNSGYIASEYSSLYPELFKYVHKENAGLGAARNTGLELVRTSYVQFLDSDDWLMPRTIPTIINKLKTSQETIDIIFMTPVVYNFATHKYEDWSDNNLLRSIFSKYTVTNPEQSIEMYSLEPSVNRCVWNYNLLKKMDFRFPERLKWEDVLPHFQIYYHAKRCIMIDNIGFYYRINTGGQITSGSGIGRLDVPTVFTKTFIYAFENSWNEVEIAHIIKMMVNFSLWSINVTDKEILPMLVKKLHILYVTIPKKYFKQNSLLSGLRPTEKLMIKILRSPFYNCINNHNKIDFGQRIIRKIKK